MFKSIVKTMSLLLGLVFFAFPVLSCPFDEAGIEVTILAYNEISKEVEAGDFKEATNKIISRKYLYEYFEKTSNEPLYQNLLDASHSKKGKQIITLLDRSLILEIQELLSQVEEMFENYQTSRIRLIKAKKHLKILTSERKPIKIMKKILKSIGNPGLMGIGRRNPNKKEFLENKKLLMNIINLN